MESYTTAYYYSEHATGIESVEAAQSSAGTCKKFINGKLVIIKDSKTYSIGGTLIK